jgi:taurine dioxygenase
MELRKLHPTLGVEVRGVDLLGHVSEQTVEALQAAMAEHQLLLFRVGRQMPRERQIEVSRWFGPLARPDGEDCFSLMTNEQPAGLLELKFHSDFTYTRYPVQGLSLHAVELPAGGASTSFVSGVNAWATLPPRLQERLATLTARHEQPTTVMMPEAPSFYADQPVRFDHPRAKRPVLLLTEYHCRRINELAPDESAALLAELFQHLYRPEHIYDHHWSRYDLVIWDNVALQHARRGRAELEHGRRVLQRVMLSEKTYEDLIALELQRETAAS